MANLLEINFLQTFFQVVVEGWKMALECYVVHLGLSNQQLSVFLKNVKNIPC